MWIQKPSNSKFRFGLQHSEVGVQYTETKWDVEYRCSLFFCSCPLSISICLNYWNSCFISALFALWFLLNHLPSSVLSHSQPSSCSPSPALSTESLSSGSDHSSSHPPLGGGASSDQEHAFTKSVSEPSICSPCDSTASPSSSSSTERLPQPSLSPYPSPSNASSAPATPQTSRSTPPRPPTTPSPLVSGVTQSHNKVINRSTSR